jgi:hypothetical protein
VRDIHPHFSQENEMRSDLLFHAKVHVSNRYQLVRLVSRRERVIHRSGQCIQDTMNEALVRFGQANPIACPNPGRESMVAAARHPKLHSSRNAEQAFELERMVGVQPLQISQPATPPEPGSADFFALSAGVLFTAVNPMLQAKDAK